MTNREIKLLMRAMGVPQWRLAKAFGVHHETVSRMLTGGLMKNLFQVIISVD